MDHNTPLASTVCLVEVMQLVVGRLVVDYDFEYGITNMVTAEPKPRLLFVRKTSKIAIDQYIFVQVHGKYIEVGVT